MGRLLDTPSKKSLWVYIIPLLSVPHRLHAQSLVDVQPPDVAVLTAPRNLHCMYYISVLFQLVVSSKFLKHDPIDYFLGFFQPAIIAQLRAVPTGKFYLDTMTSKCFIKSLVRIT